MTFRRAGVVIERMSRPRSLAAALVLAALAATGGARGLCFMPGTGEAGPRDAHGCCRTGWTEGRAECCMAGAADEEPARVAAAAPLAAPGPAVFTFTAGPEARCAGRAVPAADRAHPPPGPFPLRI